MVFQSSRSVLVVAAHPDDEILGVGGTLAKYSEDTRVELNVLVLADQITDRHVNSVTNQGQDMIIEASRELGPIKVHFGGYGQGGKLLVEYNRRYITKSIHEYVKRIRPDTLFYHRSGDAHADHDLVNECCRYVSSRTDTRFIKNALEFEVPSSSERIGSSSNGNGVYVDIEKYLDRKIAAFQHYYTEQEGSTEARSPAGIATYARYRGLNLGVSAAELFNIFYLRR